MKKKNKDIFVFIFIMIFSVPLFASLVNNWFAKFIGIIWSLLGWFMFALMAAVLLDKDKEIDKLKEEREDGNTYY